MRILVALAAATLMLAGCGGGGGHTYVMTPSGIGGAAGIYITLVSSVALPQDLVNQMKKSVTFVKQPVGPEVCSSSKTIQGLKSKYAYLNGKTLTVKINGSNPLLSLACSALKKAPFNPTHIGGTPAP